MTKQEIINECLKDFPDAVVETRPTIDEFNFTLTELENPYYNSNDNLIVCYNVVEKTEQEKAFKLIQAKKDIGKEVERTFNILDALARDYTSNGVLVPDEFDAYKEDIRALLKTDYDVKTFVLPQPPFIPLPKEKKEKYNKLNTITITTASNKVFDGRDKDQTRMMAAIKASEILNTTEVEWKLADDSVELINIDELKEALTLSIEATGIIVKG